MLNLLTLNISSLFGKGRKGADALKQATHMTKTTMQIDGIVSSISALKESMEEKFHGLHRCMERQEKESKEHRSELRDDIKTQGSNLREDIKGLSDRLDERDNHLENRIDTCQTSKSN